MATFNATVRLRTRLSALCARRLPLINAMPDRTTLKQRNALTSVRKPPSKGRRGLVPRSPAAGCTISTVNTVFLCPVVRRRVVQYQPSTQYSSTRRRPNARFPNQRDAKPQPHPWIDVHGLWRRQIARFPNQRDAQPQPHPWIDVHGLWRRQTAKVVATVPTSFTRRFSVAPTRFLPSGRWFPIRRETLFLELIS